jgi:copper chaperone CopZ
MKLIISIAIMVLSFNAGAQITKVTIQASGLTCSMCSNSINKSLQSLPIVDKVVANIKESTFDVYFKTGSSVNFDDLKKKVEDAGFFVANFYATVHFEKAALVNDAHYASAGTVFHFLNIKDQVIDGDKTIRILDKGFVTAKAYKANSKYTAMTCYATGLAGACCAKDGLKEGTRIYHATI